MAPFTRFVNNISHARENVFPKTSPISQLEFALSAVTDFPSSTSPYTTSTPIPSPLSRPEFFAISIAVCLTFIVVMSIADSLRRVRGYHLILQAEEVSAVFDTYRDRSDSDLETASPVAPGVHAGINV